MTLAVTTSPAHKDGANQSSTVVSDPFDVPPGALLVVCVEGNSSVSGTTTAAVTSSNGLVFAPGPVANFASTGEEGYAGIFTAPCPSAALGITVTVTTSGSTATTRRPSVDVFVVPGADLTTPVAASGIATTTLNNPTLSLTSTVNGSLAVVCASEWQKRGVPSAAGLAAVRAFDQPGADGVSGLAGYQAWGTAGPQTVTLDAAGTSSASWNFAYVEIRPAPVSTDPVPGGPVMVAGGTAALQLGPGPRRPLYEMFVAWTRTGQIVDQIEPSAWSYSESVVWPDLGRMQVTVPLLGRRGLVNLANRTSLRSVANAMSSQSLVLARNGRAVFAGPVYTVGWDKDSVTIGCASLGKLFDSRVLLASGWWGQPTATAADLHFELTPRDLAIQLLTEGSTGYRRDLPITIPGQTGGEGTAANYLGKDLGTVYDRLREVVERDDGPEVYLAPELYSDKTMLRWNALVGTPRIGTAATWLPGDMLPTWDYQTNVLELSGDLDASEKVRVGYVPGSSTVDTRLIGVATYDSGDPMDVALERADRTSVSEARQEQLDALARSYIDVHRYPTEAITLSVLGDHSPVIGDEWQYGDVVSLRVDGHPWLEDGDYLRRIIGVNGATSGKLPLVTSAWPAVEDAA